MEVNGHKREFTYRNNQLAQVSSNQVNLTYDYNLSGKLKSKTTPWSKTTIDRNLAGLPQNIQTHLPDGSCEENLNWYPSGKLLSYYSAAQQKTFTYTPQGFLQTAGSEKYDFAPLGVRTRAPDCNTTQNGLDPFGRIVSEQIHENEIITAYDPLGQVISQGEKEFNWDPWGRLIKVTDETSTWKASYDPFGRRLQTIYAPMNQEPLITTSFYDPEEEFREIGVHFQTQTFWKFYGPNSCDAVMDERKKSVYLMQDGLDRLTKIISSEETFDLDSSISSYGPQSPALPTDLLSYARSLVWHSLAQDPTGLIWMGARYYDPANGRFLSPNPIGYPISLDLYAYSNDDPINYLDPSGRFASPVYHSINPTIMGDWNPSWQNQGFNSFGCTNFQSLSSLGNSFFTDISASSVGRVGISNSNLKLPLTFCANGPLTQTPGGLSFVGHGWMQGINESGDPFAMGAYPSGMQKVDHQLAFCERTSYFTVYVSPEQLELAIQAMYRDHWTLWDNCVDHVVDALLAIEYPLPNGKKSFKRTASRISSPLLLRIWIEKQEGNIPSSFLPGINDQVIFQNAQKAG